MTSRWWSALWLLLAVTVWSGTVFGHSMYQSAVLLDFAPGEVKAELQLPVDRLSISFRQTVDGQHFDAERQQLASYVLAHVHPAGVDGRLFGVRLLSMNLQTVEKAPYLVVHLSFTPPTQVMVDQFRLNYDVITHEIVTHVVLVYIRSDASARIAANDPLLIGIIRGPRKSVDVDRMRLL